MLHSTSRWLIGQIAQWGPFGIGESDRRHSAFFEIVINKSPAAPEKVKQMVELIEKGCHTIHTIRNPFPVSDRLVHNGQELEVKI